MTTDGRRYAILALLSNLSDTYKKRTQNKTVVPSQEKMDWVGVEATTSAHHLAARRYHFLELLKIQQ